MTSVVAQMLPTQSQPSAKRKVQDDNPLLNAAKKAKKEAKAGASNKRKLLNAEEQPGGLLIVRAPNSTPRLSSAPPSSQLSRPPSSQSQRPPSSSGAGPSKQPSKKFRADSQPPTSKSKSSTRTRDRDVLTSAHDDLEIEEDVRAMEDEADHLRRNSRAHTTINPALTSSINPEFQFPARPPDPGSARKGKAKITDTSVPLPQEETPQIERNKLLRGGAMAALGNGRSEKTTGGGGHRRKSSINSRGKRISSSFETTGIITQPHNSVSDSSFYKHIDCDLPDAERVRQLLIWCSSRAASSSSTSSQKDPPQALPLLSAQGVQLLKSVQDDVVRMLAERKIDLSLYPPEASGSVASEPQKENEQNVTNRGWEVTYGTHIQRAMEEDEAWKKVGYTYDAYAKKTRSTLNKQTAPSAKAKGKQRAMEDEAEWKPREHELPEPFQRGVALSKSVLGLRPMGDERVVGSSRRSSIGVGLGSLELEAELGRRIAGVEFKLDQLHSFANSARTTTNMAEQALDQRFELLAQNLTARSNPPITLHDLGSASGAQVLSSYVPRAATGPDPMDLMRALVRVDKDRPPAMVGDAARRAAREVQRVGESGVGAVGERRLTGVPPPNPSQTPRKTPGTPRRGGTPARDRER